MATDKIISGIVRGVIPYAALAAVGIGGYFWLNRHGYLNGVKNAADTVFNLPQVIVKTVSDGVQRLPESIPDPIPHDPIWNPEPKKITYLDDGGVLVQRDQSLPEKVYDTLTSSDTIPESTWKDTVLKYVPAVAGRNAITRLFGN